MNIKEIQELIKFVSKSGVNEVSIEQENFKITIKTAVVNPAVQTGIFQGQHYQLQPGQAQHNPAQAFNGPQGQGSQSSPADHSGQSNQSSQTGHSGESEKLASADTSRQVIIKSPMIGTFYRTPGPDKPAFVSIGDEISAGKTVCVIEAMKLFNDIESEISGRIVKILVENASPVEYDQPLFLVEPL